MQSHEARLDHVFLEVKGCCLENIGAKFVPGLRLGENGMPQGVRAVTTFLRVANLED